MDAIDNFKPPERPIDKPFRMCVSDVYKGQGSGFTVTGKVCIFGQTLRGPLNLCLSLSFLLPRETAQ